MAMTKKELRIKYRSLRQNLSENDVEIMSLGIANQLLKLDIWSKTYFHLFLPIEKHREVNTAYVLSVLQGKDKEIVVSQANFETCDMMHFLLTDNTKFKVNSFEIPEPMSGIEVPTSQIDVVFVPLLSFDKAGHRVGYGKGFYDKFLSNCKPKIVKIGLSFFEPEDLIFDAAAHDIKLDFCVTPSQIFVFQKS